MYMVITPEKSILELGVLFYLSTLTNDWFVSFSAFKKFLFLFPPSFKRVMRLSVGIVCSCTTRKCVYH